MVLLQENAHFQEIETRNTGNNRTKTNDFSRPFFIDFGGVLGASDLGVGPVSGSKNQFCFAFFLKLQSFIDFRAFWEGFGRVWGGFGEGLGGVLGRFGEVWGGFGWFNDVFRFWIDF